MALQHRAQGIVAGAIGFDVLPSVPPLEGCGGIQQLGGLARIPDIVVRTPIRVAARI